MWARHVSGGCADSFLWTAGRIGGQGIVRCDGSTADLDAELAQHSNGRSWL